MDGKSTTVLEEHEPPFLQESTVAVVHSEPSRHAIDRLVDLAYRWRQALAFAIVPIVLIAVAVSYDAGAPDDPALSGANGGSQFGAVVAGVTAEEPPEEADGPPSANSGPAVVLPGPWPADDESESRSGADDPPPASDPATTASTTTAPTTTESTTTTEPPTTTSEATTTTVTVTVTEPPPDTLPRCLVAIDRRGNLRAEPSNGSEKLGRVSPGLYVGLGSADDGEWYRIDHEGTIGWVRERLVDDVLGDC